MILWYFVLMILWCPNRISKMASMHFLCFWILIESISYIFVWLVWPCPPARPPAHPSVKHNFKNGGRFLCFWCYDMMKFWYYDILILDYYDIMILCYYDMMLLWYYDIMLLWYYDIMIGLPEGAKSRQAQRFKNAFCRTDCFHKRSSRDRRAIQPRRKERSSAQ